MAQKASEIDFYRETKVRYLGYANEVGEALGAVYPGLVRPSYGLAFAYVFADTVDKVKKASQRGEPFQVQAQEGFDCLLWQTLASVLIPGKVINVVTHQTKHSLAKSVQASPLVKRWGPTCVGLATIPLIIKPIDDAVDYAFDHTIRKWKL